MAQKIMLSLAVFFCWTFALKAEEYKLSSPDKRLEVKLRVEGRTEFEVWYDKVKLVEPSVIGMNLSDGRHVGGDLVTSVKKDRVNRTISLYASFRVLFFPATTSILRFTRSFFTEVTRSPPT